MGQNSFRILFVFIFFLLTCRSLSAETTPPTSNDVHEAQGTVIDKRVRAAQQNRPDCWAHGFGVALKLALMGHPTHNKNPIYIAPPSRDEVKPNTAFLSLPKDPLNPSGPSPFESVFPNVPSAPPVAVVPPPQNSDLHAKLWGAANRVTAKLSNMNGGGASRYIGLARDLANRIGWKKYVDIKAVASQEALGGTAKTVSTILNGMKLGVRFSGYFNNVHAMAIIGADAKDNSLWVTDSARAGGIRKVYLNRGAHVDGLIAIVRKDNTEGSQWLKGIRGT